MSFIHTRVFPWFICSLAAIFYCYEYLLRILPSTMPEDLLQLFNMSGLSFGSLVAIYYYAYIPMQLPVGILMDRISPRKLLTFACLICSLGTYGFAQPYLIIAQISRFFVGLGSAFAFVGVMKLATLWLPPKQFGFIAGLTTSLGMVGAMIGDIFLTSCVSTFGMLAILQIAAIVGIILTIIIWILIPEASCTSKAMRSEASTQPDLKTFCLQALSLFKCSQMWLLGTIGCLLFLSLTAFAETWGISYLIRNYNLPNIIAARYNANIFLGWAIGGPLMGYLASRLGRGRRLSLMFLSTLIASVSIGMILYCPQYANPYLGALLFLFGLFSATQVIIFPIVRERNAPELAGTAFATTNLLVMLGGGIVQPLIGYLLDILSTHNPADASNLMRFSAQSFTWAISIIPAAFLIAAVLITFLKEPNQTSGSATAP